MRLRQTGSISVAGMADVAEPGADERWLTPGVRGIGTASLLADLGHEVPTAPLPSLLTSTLGAPASALGLIEGVSDGLREWRGSRAGSGGRSAQASLGRRRRLHSDSCSLRAGRGRILRVAGRGIAGRSVGCARAAVPSRNALLADVVPAGSYGRAYGFERAMDNLGAIGGPLLALALVAAFSVRTAILLSIIPGLLAVAAIVYAIGTLRGRRERSAVRCAFRFARCCAGVSGGSSWVCRCSRRRTWRPR